MSAEKFPALKMLAERKYKNFSECLKKVAGETGYKSSEMAEELLGDHTRKGYIYRCLKNKNIKPNEKILQLFAQKASLLRGRLMLFERSSEENKRELALKYYIDSLSKSFATRRNFIHKLQAANIYVYTLKGLLAVDREEIRKALSDSKSCTALAEKIWKHVDAYDKNNETATKAISSNAPKEKGRTLENDANQINS